MKKRSFIIPSLVLLLLFSTPFLAMAQIDPGCDPLDPACPIDGGVALLIAAGIGLGARRTAFRRAK